MKPFLPDLSHIYIVDGAMDYPLAHNVIERYPRAERITVPDYKMVFNRKGQDFIKQKNNDKKYKIAYHSACSMQHGQKVHDVPINLIKKTGNQVFDIPDGHICCGSAGTYNLLQYDIAEKLFPDWICRYYIGKSVPEDIISQLKEKDNEIDELKKKDLEIDYQFILIHLFNKMNFYYYTLDLMNYFTVLVYPSGIVKKAVSTDSA